ncbi:MAG: DinB family protein [Bacteroidota bacterium]
MEDQHILHRQSKDAFAWAKKLMTGVPEELWYTMPEGIGTHLAWQVGHLALSCYYHSVMVITGHQPDVLQKVAVKAYNEYYNTAQPEKSVHVHSPEELLEATAIMEEKSLSTISGMTEENLKEELFDLGFPHPVASNKWEAIDWNVKHYMYHCGQIGILRRALGISFDFRA